MNSRFRRLTADSQQINTLFGNHLHIKVSSYEGDPPDHYVFNIKVPGLEIPKEGKAPLLKHTHLVELFLLLDYPKRPPFCRMLSSVFHPNINPSKICIGDHWSAGQSVAQLIVRC